MLAQVFRKPSPGMNREDRRLFQALAEMEIGEVFAHENCEIIRLDLADYEIYFPSGAVRRLQARGWYGAEIDRAIENVIQCLKEGGKGQNMASLPLSEKHIDCLLSLHANGGEGSADDYHGSTVNSLVQRGLIKALDNGRLILLSGADAHVQEALKARRQTNGNGVKFERGDPEGVYATNPPVDRAPIPEVEPQPTAVTVDERVFHIEFSDDGIRITASLPDEALVTLYPPVIGMVEALRAMGAAVHVTNELLIVIRQTE